MNIYSVRLKKGPRRQHAYVVAETADDIAALVAAQCPEWAVEEVRDRVLECTADSVSMLGMRGDNPRRAYKVIAAGPLPEPAAAEQGAGFAALGGGESIQESPSPP